MPRKNGIECLSELKQNEKLKSIPIIVFSTSFAKEIVNSLHEQGANYYIQKPAEFSALRKIIAKSLELILVSAHHQTLKENFVISTMY